MSISAEISYKIAVSRHDRTPLELVARSYRYRLAAADGNAEEMSAIDVTAVGRVDYVFAIRGHRDVLDFALTRRQQSRFATGAWQSIEVSPSVRFRRENESIIRAPHKRIFAQHSIQRILCS